MADADFIWLLFINSERNSEGVDSFCVSTGRKYQYVVLASLRLNGFLFKNVLLWLWHEKKKNILLFITCTNSFWLLLLQKTCILSRWKTTQPFNAGTMISKGRIIAHCIAAIVSRSKCERDADDQTAGFHFGCGGKPNELEDGSASVPQLAERKKVVMTSVAWLSQIKSEDGDEDGGPGRIGRRAAATRCNCCPGSSQHKGCGLNIYWLFRSNRDWLMTSMNGKQWFFFLDYFTFKVLWRWINLRFRAQFHKIFHCMELKLEIWKVLTLN